MSDSGRELRLHAAAPRAPAAELVHAGGLAPLVGPLERVVARVSGDERLIEEAGRDLPRGAACPEAVAVRLRRAGARLVWGEPERLGRRTLRALARARGRSSVAIVRADPSLVTELQAGSWLNAYLAGRVGRRALMSARPLRGLATALGGRARAWALDAEFWRGVADAATPDEWARLTCGYTALIYHRMAGAGRPGQEELDLPPELFARQLRLLRALGFRALGEAELLRFHSDTSARLPRRAYAVTVDDGFADCLAPLAAAAAHAPQLFVPTGVVGGAAAWADGERIADWDELRELERAGVRIGSHARTHARLSRLPPAATEEELARSRAELAARVASPAALVAYPHGDHDRHVRAAAIAAGYDGAWTTEVGRNGAGTDRFCLRRVGVKARDSRLSFLWKVVTGELPPRLWEARRRRRSRPARGH